MIHFGEIFDLINSLAQILTNDDYSYYIVRDVFGRISIYYDQENINQHKIEAQAKELFGENWFNNANYIGDDNFMKMELSKSSKEIAKNVFFIERKISKKTWATEKAKNVFGDNNIITFYSYKGGVGRTTTLVLTALQLARFGKKVFVLDLDIEAPGVSTLLRPEDDIFPSFGCLDFLIESHNFKNSINTLDIDDYVYSVTDKKLVGLSGGEVFVMQAANLQDNPDNYYEKLSRVDFNMPHYSEEINPVDLMLKMINNRYIPDYVLIDSRAGIHDVGGMALLKYSKLAFLAFYGNEQNMFGLDFVLRRLVQNNTPFILLNTPVPVSEEEAQEVRDIYINKAFNVLNELNYYENDIPEYDDVNAEHVPLEIKYDVETTMLNNNKKIETVLNKAGADNFYKRLAELISSDDSENKSIPVEGNIEMILKAVSNVFPGVTPSAENEFEFIDDLTKRFYPLKEHRFIFDKNKFLVTGSKGSGKTALFSVLKHEIYAKELAKYVNEPIENVNSTIWITGLDIQHTFPSKDNFNSIASFKDLNLFRVYWQCLLIRVLNKKITECGIFVDLDISEILECKLSLLYEIIKRQPRLGEKISDLLSDLDIELEKKHEIVIVTYDALDSLLEKSFRGNMIAALIGMWFDYLPRFNYIRSKIFLREDIFRFEIADGVTDKVKLKNYTATLGWEYDYLLAMVWKRVVQYDSTVSDYINQILKKNGYSLPFYSDLIGYVPIPNSEINREIINQLIGEKMGKGNKAYTYNWIKYRLSDTNDNIVPRSIIKLFSVAAQQELESGENLNIKSDNIIKPKSLQYSIEEVSKDRLTDLQEEYVEYSNFFNEMKNYCASFPVDQDILYEAMAQCGFEETKIKTYVDELIEVGILKEYQRKKSDPVRYHLPDIYLKGMGIVRKGFR